MLKNTISCNYKSRQLLLKILSKLKKNTLSDLHMYFGILLVSWISVDYDIFMNEIDNTNLFCEDNFLTFINIWIKYHNVKNYKVWAYENYVDENTILAINNKKNEILNDLHKKFGFIYPYEYKNNFIDYEKVNYLEIIRDIKKEMLDCFISNLYYKNINDDYSFSSHSDKTKENKYAIDKNITCSVYLGEPKYYYLCFKSEKKGDNFYILQKVIYLEHNYVEK